MTPYDGKKRSAPYHKECWLQFLDQAASIIAFASCSEDFFKLLPRIETVEQLEVHLQPIKTITAVTQYEFPRVRNLAHQFLAICPESSSLLSLEFVSFLIDASKDQSTGSSNPNDNILSALVVVVDNMDAFLSRVRDSLLELEVTDQLELLSGLSTTLPMESLQACKTSVAAVRDLAVRAKCAHQVGQNMLMKFS